MDTIVIPVLMLLASAMIGYFLGSLKFTRENKMKIYAHILPKIIDFGFKRVLTDENMEDFNTSLDQAWLYANRDVALKLCAVARIKAGHEGNFTEAMQEAIVAMREDIHNWWSPCVGKIKPEEVTHMHFSLPSPK